MWSDCLHTTGAQGSTHRRVHAVRRFHRRAKLAVFYRGTAILYTATCSLFYTSATDKAAAILCFPGIAEFAGLEIDGLEGLQIDGLDNREVLIISFSITSILSHEHTNV